MDKLLNRASLGLGDVFLIGIATVWIGISWLPVYILLAVILSVISSIQLAIFRGGKSPKRIAFGVGLSLALPIIVIIDRLFGNWMDIVSKSNFSINGF